MGISLGAIAVHLLGPAGVVAALVVGFLLWKVVKLALKMVALLLVAAFIAAWASAHAGSIPRDLKRLDGLSSPAPDR